MNVTVLHRATISIALLLQVYLFISTASNASVRAVLSGQMGKEGLVDSVFAGAEGVA